MPLALFNPDLLRWPVTLAYLALLTIIATYGLHRYWLVHLFRTRRQPPSRPARRFADLPRVTVQLPMFNEAAVAERIIDAAAALDYPRDRLQVQVLDDSTDASAAVARRRVEHWRAQGIDMQYRHRVDRTGYKAGALADAMPGATGELFAIFDADFVPPANFLRRTVHHFTDPAVGMVQARWAHLNRRDSLLTRGQAILLDGHFLIEHTARNRSGAWMNFNGTAGLWRRTAIEQAGGWQHDTLTEDLDLSYRAQLVGWRFLYLPWLTCPAELPPTIHAFKNQQHRWTKGSVQCALKLLPRLLRARLPWRVKLEACFHLTAPMSFLWLTLLALLFYPAMVLHHDAVGSTTALGLIIGLVMFVLGTSSAGVFFVVSQYAQGRSACRAALAVPWLMALSIGVALNNAIACVEALVRHPSPFIRTPKYGQQHGQRSASSHRPPSLVPDKRFAVTVAELVMALYMLACARQALTLGPTIVGLPFLLLFATGYLYVGTTSLRAHLAAWRTAPPPRTQIA